jgi:hypothetical protein
MCIVALLVGRKYQQHRHIDVDHSVTPVDRFCFSKVLVYSTGVWNDVGIFIDNYKKDKNFRLGVSAVYSLL